MFPFASACDPDTWTELNWLTKIQCLSKSCQLFHLQMLEHLLSKLLKGSHRLGLDDLSFKTWVFHISLGHGIFLRYSKKSLYCGSGHQVESFELKRIENLRGQRMLLSAALSTSQR